MQITDIYNRNVIELVIFLGTLMNMNNIQKQLINEMQNALFGWYSFEHGKRVLVVSDTNETASEISKYLNTIGVGSEYCTVNDINRMEYNGVDYCIIYNAIEVCERPDLLLMNIKKSVSKECKLFIATNNRLAVKFFCGEKDPLSGHVFDGIVRYAKCSNNRKKEFVGRCYSYSELDNILTESGLVNRKIYSVLPDIKCPQIILSQSYKPNETLEARIFPHYNTPNTIFLDEESLYDSLADNGLLAKMAGGFLIECSFNNNVKLSEINQITVQPDRGHEESLATIIYDDKVIKKPLYKEGIKKINVLTENAQDLINHGISVVCSDAKGNQFEMPYIKGVIATLHFREQAKKGRDVFLDSLKEWKSIIEKSSEHVDYSEVNWRHFDPYWKERKADDPNIEKWEKLANGTEKEKKEIGVILKRGYVDLVSLNCFYKDGCFIFFDQEFYTENYPANSIIIRTIDLIYRDCLEIEDICPRDELLKELNLFEHKDMWRKQANAFLEKLRNERPLKEYHQKTRRNNAVTAANRIRMDYSNDEYNQLFNNLFKNVDCKKVYIFGSGIYSKRFVDSYGSYLNISGVLDNNKERWGEEFCGSMIMSPDILLTENDNYKVIICIKYYDDVYKQLKDMGVKDISIYDSRLSYEKPAKAVVVKNESDVKKKYHIGYIAGVFDLFHLGHVNLLRRAKEQCDYLIVGIVSDEQIINGKGTKPYMSFEERREIVASCRYVDEAVGIPVDRPDTEDAWRIHKFDVQFSGSDYENDPKWIAKREFLRERGSDLVFFPYTQSVSSTKLKEKIREQL